VKTQHDEEAIVTGHEGGKGRNAYRLGALTLKTPDGREFSCGSGLTDADRLSPPAIGSVVTYRFTELMDNGFPRFPVFVAPRIDLDWDDYCASYAAPDQSTFAAPGLQREHSIMYAAPGLQRTLSDRANAAFSATAGAASAPASSSSSSSSSSSTGDPSGFDTEEYDSEEVEIVQVATAKKRPRSGQPSSGSGLPSTLAATAYGHLSTPELARELGVGLDEARTLRRLECGACEACGLRARALGHPTCCRGCALGEGCTCDNEDNISPPPSKLARSRSEQLASETGLSVAEARAILAENDQAAAQ